MTMLKCVNTNCKYIFFVTCLIPCTSFIIRHDAEGGPMLRMLDAMQQMMTGGGRFDRALYRELRMCMAWFDPRLPLAQDRAWQGMISMWRSGGLPGDKWGSAPSNYSECNVTATNVENMEIYEPCNYASNFGYYLIALELCKHRDSGAKFHWSETYTKAMGKAACALAVSSSIYHGTNTRMGNQQDLAAIDIFGYIMYEAALSGRQNLPEALLDLSGHKRPHSPLEAQEVFFQNHLNYPIDTWYKRTKQIDSPKRFFVTLAFSALVLATQTGPWLVRQIIPPIAQSFYVGEEDQAFLRDVFLPEVDKLFRNVDTKRIRRTSRIGQNFPAVILKFSYALFWIEWYDLIPREIALNPSLNAFGGLFVPLLNKKANFKNNYKHFQMDFQRGKNVYPGEAWCNPINPHTKWHVESAIALVDLIHLANDLHIIMKDL